MNTFRRRQVIQCNEMGKLAELKWTGFWNWSPENTVDRFFKIPRVWLLFGLVCLFSSCSLKIYGPNHQIVPALKQLGDVELQGGLGVGEEVEFTDLSLAIAVHEHWTLVAKGNYARDKRNNNSTLSGQGYLGEVALARNWWISPNTFLQLQAGTGFGHQYHLSENSGSISFPWNRIYLQPALKYAGDLLELAISSRMGRLQFGRAMYGLDYPAQEGFPGLREQLPNRQVWMIEPALTLSVGSEKVKLYAQGSLAYYSRRFPAEDFFLGIGIVVHLPSK